MPYAEGTARRKKTPLSDDELLAAIDAAEELAQGAHESTIATARADAIARYLGREYTGELAPAPGRSSVVSRDVADCIDGVLANVIKPFVGGDEVVRFDPLGPDDEERSQQETDYVNWVVMERNNGFLVLNACMKDALLTRVGYAKMRWLKRDDVILETYRGLSDEELSLLLDDQDVEVVQHTAQPDPYAVPPAMAQQPPLPGAPPGAPGMPPQVPQLHDVKVRRARPTEYCCIDPCPPEEVLVSQRSRSPCLQDCDFVQHRTHQTLSELRQMGYAVDDDITDDDSFETQEDYARQRQSPGNMFEDDTQDRARRVVLFKETWMRVDYDGDGVAELRRVCQVGHTLLANDEADLVPIAAFCPILMPHQHAGISVYDMVEDLAKLKTALLRAFMDNKYLSNNSRVAANAQTVEIDDLLQSRPGGVVRINGPVEGNLLPLVTPDTGASALQGLEYLDSVRESRTGYTRQTQGLETDALVSKTVGGMVMQLTQSQLRLEMIARTIAETGVREMFKIVHALTLKYSTRAEKVRLQNKWVDVNPREWVRRTDLSIAVGIGASNQQAMVSGLAMIAQAQRELLPAGLVKRDNLYNMAKRMCNAAGFKDVDAFFTPPETDPQTGKVAEMPPQPPEAVLVEQERQKGDAQKTQATLAHQQQTAQMELMGRQKELELQAMLKKAEQEGALALQQSNDQRQSALDLQKAELERSAREQQMQLDRYKIELETQSKQAIEAAKIQAQMEMKKMELTFQTTARAEDRDKLDSGNHKPRKIQRDAGGKLLGVDIGGVFHEAIRDEQGRVVGTKPASQTVQ